MDEQAMRKTMPCLDRRDFLKAAGFCVVGMALGTGAFSETTSAGEAMVTTLLTRVLMLAEDIHNVSTAYSNLLLYTTLMQRGNPKGQTHYETLAQERIERLDQLTVGISRRIRQSLVGTKSLLELDPLKFEPVLNATPELRAAIHNVNFYVELVTPDNLVKRQHDEVMLQRSIERLGELISTIEVETKWWRLPFQHWWWTTASRQDLRPLIPLVPWVNM